MLAETFPSWVDEEEKSPQFVRDFSVSLARLVLDPRCHPARART
jgi:hypothetical protein